MFFVFQFLLSPHFLLFFFIIFCSPLKNSRFFHFLFLFLLLRTSPDNNTPVTPSPLLLLVPPPSPPRAHRPPPFVASFLSWGVTGVLQGVLRGMDYMGTAVFALSGTVTAGQVGMDLMGRWNVRRRVLFVCALFIRVYLYTWYQVQGTNAPLFSCPGTLAFYFTFLIAHLVAPVANIYIFFCVTISGYILCISPG